MFCNPPCNTRISSSLDLDLVAAAVPGTGLAVGLPSSSGSSSSSSRSSSWSSSSRVTAIAGDCSRARGASLALVATFSFLLVFGLPTFLLGLFCRSSVAAEASSVAARSMIWPGWLLVQQQRTRSKSIQFYQSISDWQALNMRRGSVRAFATFLLTSLVKLSFGYLFLD